MLDILAAADPAVVRAFGYLLISATALGTAFGLTVGWVLKHR